MIDWDNFQPSPWHKDECKQFIMTWAHPEEAPCICQEVSAAYQRGRDDAANNLGAFIAKYYYHFAVEIVEPLLATARVDGEQA